MSALCKAAPAIVSQQQLIESVWPETVVGDETLKQRVKLLRRALDDNAAKPSYIEAIRGRGYRILPQVETVDLRPQPQVQPPNPTTSSEAAPYQEHSPRHYYVPHTLPQDGFPEIWKWTAMGLFALLLAGLIGINTYTLFNPQHALPLIIDTESSKEETASETLSQDRSSQPSFAQELYVKGLDYYHRYRAEDNRHAIELFQSSIDIEPSRAQTYAALADAYSQGVFQFNGPELWQSLAIDNAYRAITLAPELAHGYKSLGLAYYNKGWLAKAAKANLRAIQKQSNFNEAMSNLGYIYREMGQLNESLIWADKALKADKHNSGSMLHKAQSLMALADYPQAKYWLDRGLKLQPDSILANQVLMQWHNLQGDFNQAQAHFLGLNDRLQTTPLLQEAYLVTLSYLDKKSTITTYLQRQDNGLSSRLKVRLLQAIVTTPLAQQEIDALKAIYQKQLDRGSDRASDSLAMAMLSAKLGDSEATYLALGRGIHQGGLNRVLISRHPVFSSFIQEPRFQQLLVEIDTQQAYQQGLSRK